MTDLFYSVSNSSVYDRLQCVSGDVLKPFTHAPARAAEVAAVPAAAAAAELMSHSPEPGVA